MLDTPIAVAGLISILSLGAACAWIGLTSKQRKKEREATDKLALQAWILEDHAASPILLISADGLIRRVNSAAQQVFGYAKDDLLGQNISCLTRRIPAPGEAGIHAEVVCRNGTRLFMHCSAVDISGEDAYVFFENPTAKNAPPERRPGTLEVAERVVSRIVKQLEGLLTTINGYVELALHESAENSAVRKDLEEAATASDGASRLTRHLLAFVGNQPIPREYVDLNALLEGLQPKFESVQMEVTGEHLYVLANRQCLQQIVSVFCGSATHRAGRGAAKQIITSRRQQGLNEYAAIAISDGGPALPAATLDCLFEPLFFDREGLGVELSAVYGMVKNFGGSINVASDEDRGTTFEILIPLAVDRGGGNAIKAPVPS